MGAMGETKGGFKGRPRGTKEECQTPTPDLSVSLYHLLLLDHMTLQEALKDLRVISIPPAKCGGVEECAESSEELQALVLTARIKEGTSASGMIVELVDRMKLIL